MKTLNIFILINFCLAVLLVLEMIFISKRKPERIIAWALVLFSLPFVGVFLYLLIGAGLNIFSKNMMKKYEISSKFYNKNIKNQIKSLKSEDLAREYPDEYRDLILLNLKNAGSMYSRNNIVKCFCDGPSVLEELKNDIQNAKTTIHLEFYIFANDKTGKELMKLLIQKANEGVEVRVLYDAIGSIKTSKLFFKKLKKAGGHSSQFFPPFLNIKMINFNANYRNHRKICVIDGKIAYTGGFNIRNDHMGLNKRLSPWRDTSIKICGGAVHSFQNIFLSDWRFSTKDSLSVEQYINPKFFPDIESRAEHKVSMQVLESGPTKFNQQIKTCMIKMILSAKKSIKIQTPYFVPDESFADAIKLALMSGVEVELMFPQKVDHWSVHFASFSYINELLNYGLKIYIYKGFLHSKVLIIDDEIMTIGSCNIDIRSFALNFEDNVVIFDKDFCQNQSAIFEQDKQNCDIYDEKARKNKNIFHKFLINFCRLFSSVL